MTSLETTFEAPQITNFADIPIEFWIAMCIQIFILVFGIWAVAKLIKFLVISAPARVARRFSADEKTTPTANQSSSIDDDFADIAEEMRREKNNG